MQTKELIAKLSSGNEVLEALRQIRQEVDTNENMLTQLLPTIPTIAEISKTTKNEQIRFETILTAYCFTQSEAESDLQMLIESGCIPIFCDSLSAEASHDMIRVCCMALHNLACDSIARRDQIISLGAMKKLTDLLTTAVQQRMPNKVIEKVVMAIGTLVSMIPAPEFQQANEVIPILRDLLLLSDDMGVMAYTLQAVKYIVKGYKEHVQAATGPLFVPRKLIDFLFCHEPYLFKPALSIITTVSSNKAVLIALVVGGLLRNITADECGVYKPCVILRNVASFCEGNVLLSQFLEAKNCIGFLVSAIHRSLTTEDPKKEEAREYAVEALLHLVKFATTKDIRFLMKHFLVEILCYVIVHDEHSTMLCNAVEALYHVVKKIPRAEYLELIYDEVRKRLDSIGTGDGVRMLSLMCRRVMDEAGFPIVTLFRGMHKNSESCKRSFLDIHIQTVHHQMKKRKRGDEDELQQAEEDEQPAKVFRSLPTS